MVAAVKTEQIWVLAEHCTLAGKIVEETDDAWLWGEGTEEQLLTQAVQVLGSGRGTGHGQTTPYQRKCARNVLQYFGVSEEEVEA